ncbi:sugar phosphate isomerase/epimerase family protein [Amycolatopsis mongoliensis]|uniref:Sugar phosphate isomerase/epimerase family protein n=1 Tax=Amycolatopsis mongoliensis TaxID=715475 RepID=A0A9Y2JI39_9PSEU|nr:sugar phosphate isomerase/epimerase family protein [Amycolatopsis sp. 4-36]WIX99035.1 sugar phosphate isomerase/epimerase family protein [Amycolatopsis sp. 4-36]
MVHPDEAERSAAVRYWKRMIEVTAELGCSLMNSEFNGSPATASASEAAFWCSLEELLPVFEREGIALNLEAHPDDFCEVNDPAVGLVGAVNLPWVNYLYCALRTFHLSGNDPGADVGKMLRYAGSTLAHLHIADSYSHEGSSGLRCIMNPPGTPARIHQSTWTSGRVRSIGVRSFPLCASFGSMGSLRFVFLLGRNGLSSLRSSCLSGFQGARLLGMRLRRGVGNRRFLFLLPARCGSADSPRNGVPAGLRRDHPFV